MSKNQIKLIMTLLAFFFLILQSQAMEASTKLIVTAELANVRAMPSIGSAIIRQIPKGILLESIRKEGEWYLVKLDPDEAGISSGYVHESLVAVAEETPKAEKVEKPKEPIISSKEVQTSPRQSLGSQPSIALTGGGNYFIIGDLNDGAKGLADYYGADLGIDGEGTVAPIHICSVFGGEISFLLSPRFFLNMGAEFIESQKESLVKYQKGSFSYTFTTTPEFQAIPIKLSFSYYPVASLYFKFGLAYYFAKCNYDYRFEHDESWEERKGEAKAQSIGFFGALGYEWSLATNFAFFIELESAYALIKGFEGKETYQNSETEEITNEEGKLYFFFKKISNLSQTLYPQLFIRSKVPTEAYVENPDEAQLDLSGIALKLGLKIKF